MIIPTEHLVNFVAESNLIEGITFHPTSNEMYAHSHFFERDKIEVSDLGQFVSVVARAELRIREGMNVKVGSHVPPRGGYHIFEALSKILEHANSNPEDAYAVHHDYETLHPFMDGNGRSGRVLWAWMMAKAYGPERALELGFLHRWYYQSLSAGR